MVQPESLEHLRELLLNAPESDAVRVVAIALSALLLGTVLWLVRSQRLREEYTPIWMITAFGIFAISLRLDTLKRLTVMIGAWTPSSTIFFLGDLFLIAICLNYAVRLSRASVQLKNLAQEIALANERLDRMEPRPPASQPSA
jgi:hypothetical protein